MMFSLKKRRDIVVIKGNSMPHLSFCKIFKVLHR